MGWRERLFGSRLTSQICTVAKTNGSVKKFRTPSLTAAVPDAPSETPETPSETPETPAETPDISETEQVLDATTQDTQETVPSRTLLASAALAVTTPPPFPQVIGINPEFITACTYTAEQTKEETELTTRNPSDHDLDPDLEDLISITSVSSANTCRICQDKTDEKGNERLISPCACSGSAKYVHQSCLKTWTGIKGSTYCEICQQPYNKEYVRIPLCMSEDFGTNMVTITIVLILLTVVASGLFLLLDDIGHVHPPRDEAHSRVELYISISLIITGFLGIGVFIPYMLYWLYMTIDLRCRRLRRHGRRDSAREVNV